MKVKRRAGKTLPLSAVAPKARTGVIAVKVIGSKYLEEKELRKTEGRTGEHQLIKTVRQCRNLGTSDTRLLQDSFQSEVG